MGRPSKLTDEQLEQMVLWRERGWSHGSIAKRLGVSDAAINYRCLALGVISPNQLGRTEPGKQPDFEGKDGRTCRRFTEEEDARMRALSTEGVKLNDIATAMGRPRTSVRMRLMLLGAHEEIASSRELA